MQSESPPVMFRAQAGVEGALFEESFLANRGGTFSMRGSVGEAALAPFNPLKAGIEFETQQLAELGLPKNTTVFRPTLAETESAAFNVIVGPPRFTPGGQPRGTIFDATQGGLTEIKGGSSTMDSSYQLRLQVYRSLKLGEPYTIQTTRPLNPTFADWLQRWGVTVSKPRKR